MTPFWNATSPSNLYPAAMGILNCAQTLCDSEDELFWKIGRRARIEIFKTGIAIEQPTRQQLAARERLKLKDGDMMFCGLRGTVENESVPPNECFLYSASKGHVGTVKLVNLEEFA